MEKNYTLQNELNVVIVVTSLVCKMKINQELKIEKDNYK